MFFYRLLGKLPLPVLYGLASVVRFLFNYVISYRKKVIEANLKNSFPEKSELEIKTLRNKFYGYLTDQLVEFFYGVRISPEEMMQRMQFVNEEIITKHLNNNQPVVLAVIERAWLHKEKRHVQRTRLKDHPSEPSAYLFLGWL